MDIKEILNNLTIEGNVVRLPNVKLDRKVYIEIAKKLEIIGGKWKSGKIKGFIFQNDPSDLIEMLKDKSESNIKKEFQFFETPINITNKLIDLADINIDHKILEPSAGKGAIINSIHMKYPLIKIYYYELMDINRKFLEKIDNVSFLGNDFLECNEYFDRIIGNPPFTKNQDILHVMKMYDCLKDNGKLVSVTSTHWVHSNNKKELQFKEWLKDKKYKKINLSAGEFKESGTKIETIILVIDK